MSAKRTDMLTPGDLVETGLVMATRVVREVMHDGERAMRVVFCDEVFVESAPADRTAHQSRLWVLPDSQPTQERPSA